ncbi:MAG: AraC family transcriptional regulator [Bdellovibrionales bacterium]|nr:AraC family transcriptional regulator [Bdellovibrionales bacterium]
MAKQTSDIVAEFQGLTIIHQKIPSHEVGRHAHLEHEFFLPLQGEITIQHGNTVVKAGPGKMLYVPPKLDHSFSSRAQGSGERVIWLIQPKLWSKYTSLEFGVTALQSNSLAKELLFFLLIHRETEGERYFISALIASLVESLAGAKLGQSVLFTEHIEGKILDERVKKSVRSIESNIANVNLAEVARASGLSQRNFNRLFLQEAGLTPKDYIILRRIETAKQLLRESKLTVTDISLEVGYNSLSKFIAMFKKIEGCLPSDYRSGANRLK